MLDPGLDLGAFFVEARELRIVWHLRRGPGDATQVERGSQGTIGPGEPRLVAPFAVAVVVEDRVFGQKLVLFLIEPLDLCPRVQVRLEQRDALVLVQVCALPRQRLDEELAELGGVPLARGSCCGD